MGLEIKQCKSCGKLVELAKSCDICLSCRVRILKAGELDTHRRYYLKNRAVILLKAKDRREERAKEHKEGGKPKRVYIKSPKESPRWTVEFIKNEEGYSWRAWFRNPVTGRLVKFESAKSFSDIMFARNDYMKATR